MNSLQKCFRLIKENLENLRICEFIQGNYLFDLIDESVTFFITRVCNKTIKFEEYVKSKSYEKRKTKKRTNNNNNRRIHL